MKDIENINRGKQLSDESDNIQAINTKGINHGRQLSDKSDNMQVINLEDNASPFKIYEEKYCNKCEDYRGCLGLIDQMTMELQDSKSKTGNEGLDSMVKSMGGLTFSARFKMILDCSNLRNHISKIK